MPSTDVRHAADATVDGHVGAIRILPPRTIPVALPAGALPPGVNVIIRAAITLVFAWSEQLLTRSVPPKQGKGQGSG